MLDAHEAHTIVLTECDIITAGNAAALLAAVAQVRAEGSSTLAYKPGVEDLFFHDICQVVVELMSTAYPELKELETLIEKATRLENDTAFGVGAAKSFPSLAHVWPSQR